MLGGVLMRGENGAHDWDCSNARAETASACAGPPYLWPPAKRRMAATRVYTCALRLGLTPPHLCVTRRDAVPGAPHIFPGLHADAVEERGRGQTDFVLAPTVTDIHLFGAGMGEFDARV